MRHEYRIRFAQTLRRVRLAEANAAPSADNLSAAAAAQLQTEVELARELEQRERRAIDETLTALNEAAESLISSRNELLGEMQQAAVELALAVAMRVTYDKLQTDRFAIEELVQAVVARVAPAKAVQVRMHPDDLALLHRRSEAGQLQQLAEMQFIPDTTLGRGDCVVDAGDVSFDSCLEEQLDGLRRHLLRNINDAQVERRKAATGDRELRRFPDRRQTA